jgi:putative ABC transport system ATP-binding protein
MTPTPDEHSRSVPDPKGPVVEVNDLAFHYPRAPTPALALHSLTLDRGERLLVHGQSGSGKSTLLSLLAGVLIGPAGRVKLLGADWHGLSTGNRDRRRGDHVGYIFQQFNLLPWLSTIDNVVLACRFSNRRAARARARYGDVETAAAHWLDALGLGPSRWPQAAGTLSVGEQQRVAAARALMGEPELLLADEPTSALDEARRDEFMALLSRACSAAGSALVLVSHDSGLTPHFSRRLLLERPQ